MPFDSSVLKDRGAPRAGNVTLMALCVTRHLDGVEIFPLKILQSPEDVCEVIMLTLFMNEHTHE